MLGQGHVEALAPDADQVRQVSRPDGRTGHLDGVLVGLDSHGDQLGELLRDGILVLDQLDAPLLGQGGSVHEVHRLLGVAGEDPHQHGDAEQTRVVLGDPAPELGHDAVHRPVAQALGKAPELLAQRHEGRERLHLLGPDGRDVDGVGDHSGGKGAAHLVGGDRAGPVLRLGGRGSQVGRHDDVVATEQRVIGHRLLGEDVERRPGHLARVQRGLERLQVHELAASAVHDSHAVLHLGDRLGVDPVDGVGGLRQVDGHDVGPGVEVVAGFGAVGSEIAKALRGHELVERHHLHLEGAGPVRDELADPAEADHSERLAVELVAGEPGPGPLSADERCLGLRNVAAQGQDQRERVLGRGDRVGLGRVDDHDPPLGRGPHVHVVHTSAGAPDHLEARRAADQVRGELGGGPDHDPVELADSLPELPVGEPEPDLHVEVLAQELDAGVRDLLRDQDLRLALGH
jgi:hypothetical protein